MGKRTGLLLGDWGGRGGGWESKDIFLTGIMSYDDEGNWVGVIFGAFFLSLIFSGPKEEGG